MRSHIYIIVILSIILLSSCGGENDSRDVVATNELVNKGTIILDLLSMPYMIEETELKLNDYGDGYVQRVYVDDFLLYTEEFTKDMRRKLLYFQCDGTGVGAFGEDANGKVYYVQHATQFQVALLWGEHGRWPSVITINNPPEAGMIKPYLAVIILENDKYRALSKNEIVDYTRKVNRLDESWPNERLKRSP